MVEISRPNFYQLKISIEFIISQNLKTLGALKFEFPAKHVKIEMGMEGTIFELQLSNFAKNHKFNPKKTGGGASDASPSPLSSAISSSLEVPCSYLVTFHFNPFNKS